MTLPYVTATSGQRAIDDMRRTVQAFDNSVFGNGQGNREPEPAAIPRADDDFDLVDEGDSWT